MTRDEVDVDDNQTREKANEVTIERKVPRTLNERKEGEVKKRFVPRQPRKDKRRWLGEHGKMTQSAAGEQAQKETRRETKRNTMRERWWR